MRATAATSLLLMACAAAAQDKPPAKPEPKAERITYRLTGLFSKDREKDLRAGFAELADIKLVAVDFKEAEITVEFAPAKLWPGQKPQRVTELLNDKVRSATSHTFGIKPRRDIARDKLTEVVIPAAGCDCKGCNLAAYEAVANLDGVYRATSSFKDGRVTALIDPTRTDKAKLVEALRKKGVDVGKP
jgi:copper chaperone CopZ